MMRWIKWAGVAAAILLIYSCFQTWVYIISKKISVSGVDATGTSFGRPGYFHLLLTFFFLAFALTPKIWAKRINLVVTAMNFAWSIRNYFLISACRGGECPEKHIAIYLVLTASLVMLISSLFPDLRLPSTNSTTRSNGEKK